MTNGHAEEIIMVLQALLKQHELIVEELIRMRPPTPPPTSDPQIRTL